VSTSFPLFRCHISCILSTVDVCRLYRVVLCIHSLPKWNILILGGQYFLCNLYILDICESRLKSSWTHLIIPSRKFVEVWWRSVFRSTSFGKRCTSYNALPTSRKCVADRWSLRNFLPRSSFFMVGKAPEITWGRDLDCLADVLMGFHWSNFSNSDFIS
jgi:hypothetical protein